MCMMKRYVVSLAAVMSFMTAGAQTVTPQACEQSIVTPKAEGRYLWLPVQESAPEGKVQVIVNGSGQRCITGLCAECADRERVLQ